MEGELWAARYPLVCARDKRLRRRPRVSSGHAAESAGGGDGPPRPFAPPAAQHRTAGGAADLNGGFGRALYARRGQVERDFGSAGGFGCGLQPLPNFVRRPRRVVLWAVGKLIINELRIWETTWTYGGD